MASDEEQVGKSKKKAADPEKQAAEEAAAAELEQNQQYLEDEAQAKGPLGNPLTLLPASDDEEKEPPKDDGKLPLLYEGTWVTLASTDNFPEEVWGHEAYITNAPMKNSDGDEKVPYPHQYQDEDTVFTVRTRDEYSATLFATRDDFADISLKGGRVGLGHSG